MPSKKQTPIADYILKINKARDIVTPIIGEHRFKFVGEVFQFVSDNITFSQRMELTRLDLQTKHYTKLYEEFLINAKKTSK